MKQVTPKIFYKTDEKVETGINSPLLLKMQKQFMQQRLFFSKKKWKYLISCYFIGLFN